MDCCPKYSHRYQSIKSWAYRSAPPLVGTPAFVEAPTITGRELAISITPSERTTAALLGMVPGTQLRLTRSSRDSTWKVGRLSILQMRCE